MRNLFLLTTVLSSLLAVEADNQCLARYSEWFPSSDPELIVDFMVHYRCPPGFTLEGSSDMATCSDSSTSHPTGSPRCVKLGKHDNTICEKETCKTCNKPDEVNVPCSTKEFAGKGNSSHDKFCAGDRVYFICNDECRRVGNPSFIECQADGSWSQTDVKCERDRQDNFCFDSSLDVPNTKIVDSFTRQQSYPPGTVVKFECNDQRKFCMLGTDTRTCLPTGKWSQAPECLSPLCPISVTHTRSNSGVHVISHSADRIDATGQYYYHGSHVHYACEEGYGRIRGAAYIECLCTSGGKWTRPSPPVCEKIEPICTTPVPPEPNCTTHHPPTNPPTFEPPTDPPTPITTPTPISTTSPTTPTPDSSSTTTTTITTPTTPAPTPPVITSTTTSTSTSTTTTSPTTTTTSTTTTTRPTTTTPDPCNGYCEACLKPPRLDEFEYDTVPAESSQSQSAYFSLGTKIRIKACRGGKFAVAGNRTLICERLAPAPDNRFVWSGTLPYCEKDCQLPSSNIANGHLYIKESASPSEYRWDKAQPDLLHVHPGSRLFYICNTGYVATGAVARQCIQNGTWLPDTAPECLPNITNAECCPTPTCDNSVEPDQIRSSGEFRTALAENTRQYELGGTIVWRCKDGYTNLQPADAKSTCRKNSDGKYVFDNPAPKCELLDEVPTNPGTDPVLRTGGGKAIGTKQVSALAVTKDESTELILEPEEGAEPPRYSGLCRKPPTPANSYEKETRTKGKPFHPLRFESGDTISYHCRKPFSAIGDTFITCLENGRWSSKPPQCARQTYCIDPVRLTNATQYLTTLRFLEETYLFEVDAVIHYRCKRGQYLVGADRIVCRNDGTWSERPGVCQKARTTCPIPNDPTNARLVSISADPRELYPGSRLAYVCASGYVSSSRLATSTWTCQADGSWSVSNSLRCLVSFVEPKLPFCRMPPMPENVINVYKSMTVIGDEKLFVPGGSIIYRCDDNFSPMGSDRIVCNIDGTWSAPPPQCGMELSRYLAMRL